MSLIFLIIISNCNLYIDRWNLVYPEYLNEIENYCICNIDVSEEEILIKFQFTSKNISPLTINRDSEKFGEEKFTVILTFNENRENGFLFSVNAVNRQLDAKISCYNEKDITWDEIWFSNINYNDTIFEGIIKLPIEIFDISNENNFNINIFWTSKTDKGIEIAAFCPIEKGYRNYDLRYTKKIDILLYFEENNRISLFPYIAFFNNRENFTDAGIYFSYSMNNFETYITLNPEYNLIEADIDQFNLNKANMIYLNEKRRFFIEGFELWDMPFEVLYTRSITDIDVGGKFNYYFGKFKINAFSIVETDTSQGRFYLCKDNVLGGTRIVLNMDKFFPGVFYINKGNYEEVYGGDFKLFLPSGFKIYSQISFTEGKDLYFYASRWGGENNFWINSGFEYLDSSFDFSTAYFSYEKNTYSYWLYAGYNWAFKRNLLTGYSISAGGVDAYFLDGDLFERSSSFGFGINPLSNLGFSYSLEPSRKYYNSQYFYNCLHRVSGEIGVNQPQALQIETYFGKYFGNWLEFYNYSLRFSISDRLFCSAGYAVEEIDNIKEERITLKATFKPLDKIYIRCFAQRSTISDRRDFNILLQYEFFAGSNIYLIYNYSEDNQIEENMMMSKISYEFKF